MSRTQDSNYEAMIERQDLLDGDDRLPKRSETTKGPDSVPRDTMETLAEFCKSAKPHLGFKLVVDEDIYSSAMMKIIEKAFLYGAVYGRNNPCRVQHSSTPAMRKAEDWLKNNEDCFDWSYSMEHEAAYLYLIKAIQNDALEFAASVANGYAKIEHGYIASNAKDAICQGANEVASAIRAWKGIEQ